MAILTIITPTYNRAGLLKNLYNSLEQQTSHEFEWLIVDDGSKDNTKEVVDAIAEKATFPISYIYKENGGKHTALNIGIKTIKTDLTMIVDSDDQLLPNAVMEIEIIHKKYKCDAGIGAYCFLRCFSNGKPIISLVQDEFVESYVKYRIKENRLGDMAEVFKTRVLRENPFPRFSGERFLSEDVVWIQIGLKYQFVFINKVIYQCEYLEGGLTDNDKPMKFASPCGSMMRGKMLMHKECGIKQNIKGAIIYDCYKRNTRIIKVDERLLLNRREKLLCFLSWGISYLFYNKWQKR